MCSTKYTYYGQPFCFDDVDVTLIFDMLCSVIKTNIKALVIYISQLFCFLQVIPLNIGSSIITTSLSGAKKKRKRV